MHATVSYTIGSDDDQLRTAEVKLIDGYTTAEDIPKIIAVSRTGRPADAVFIHVTYVEWKDDAPHPTGS